MAKITAALVKELRERTGVGMMECKKALVATDGDIDAAIEEMRKSGQAKAAKKAGRVAAEGVLLVKASADNRQAAVVEVNSETDFVARDENFLSFANQASDAILAANTDDLETIKGLDISGQTIEEARTALVAKIGENINIRRVVLVDAGENGQVASYIHGGRIAAVVLVEGGDQDLAKDLAMHVAASNPLVVNPSDVPEDVVAKEKEIFTAQAEQSGKPAEIIEKMITGRISKFLNEVALVGQPFVKDPNTKVSALLKSAKATVTRFIRLEVGEGIEKEEVSFADEVAAQVSQARGE